MQRAFVAFLVVFMTAPLAAEAHTASPTTAELPQAWSEMSSVATADGSVYLFGGWRPGPDSNDYVRSLEAYKFDPSTEELSRIRDLPSNRAPNGLTPAAVVDGRVLVFARDTDVTRILEYRPLSDTYTVLAETTRIVSAATAHDGKAYFLAEGTGYGTYEPDTGELDCCAPSLVTDQTALVSTGDAIYTIAGPEPSPNARPAKIFRLGSCCADATFPEQWLYDAAATWDGSRIRIFGGYTWTGDSQSSPRIYSFDPQSLALIRESETLPSGRWGATAVHAEGRTF
ncbi:MAG TPA: kelch repeat-containing protein, partial [Candidatus Thermoplasmatota archaeon]|nr:kelch repeat-containing protein [Candidatus Thermoplasmatota archaeon]